MISQKLGAGINWYSHFAFYLILQAFVQNPSPNANKASSVFMAVEFLAKKA